MIQWSAPAGLNWTPKACCWGISRFMVPSSFMHHSPPFPVLSLWVRQGLFR